jgi:hypothetical protein
MFLKRKQYLNRNLKIEQIKKETFLKNKLCIVL